MTTTHKGGQEAVSMVGKLGMGMNGSQIFECAKLVGGVCSFQTTFAQLASMCKGHCTCFPLRNLVVRLHKEGVGVAEPLYVSFDPPILELPSGLHEVMIHRGRPQEDGFEPWWEWFDWFGRSHWLSVYLEDVG